MQVFDDQQQRAHLQPALDDRLHGEKELALQLLRVEVVARGGIVRLETEHDGEESRNALGLLSVGAHRPHRRRDFFARHAGRIVAGDTVGIAQQRGGDTVGLLAKR